VVPFRRSYDRCIWIRILDQIHQVHAYADYAVHVVVKLYTLTELPVMISMYRNFCTVFYKLTVFVLIGQFVVDC